MDMRGDFDLFARKNVQVIAVVDTNFGDNGKGKFVDLLSCAADVTVRGTGGSNAGHTIVHGGVTHVFHLLPSSISRDAEGKVSIVGRGTVVNPGAFTKELRGLDEKGMPSEGLRMSQDAHLVLPTHLMLDHVFEASAGDGKIGTTKQGIGPAYADHRARIGVRVNDLLNPDTLAKNVRRSIERARLIFRGADGEAVLAAIEAVEDGVFRGPDFVDEDAVIAWLRQESERFRECITDTDVLVQSMLKDGKRVLLEGAQGVMLSIECGTYPFVTSSDCSAPGLAQGSGLRTEDIGYTASIVKAYATRVGEGPFPTELTDTTGEALRKLGNEFGATTGRPRRVGWLDLPLLRYAMRFASDTFVLTKADVLQAFDSVSVCTAYRYEGPDYRVGGRSLKKGDRLTTALPYAEVLRHCEPEYRRMHGWASLDVSMDSKSVLPADFQDFMKLIEREASATVDILSVGPDRGDTIVF